MNQECLELLKKVLNKDGRDVYEILSREEEILLENEKEHLTKEITMCNKLQTCLRLNHEYTTEFKKGGILRQWLKSNGTMWSSDILNGGNKKILEKRSFVKMMTDQMEVLKECIDFTLFQNKPGEHKEWCVWANPETSCGPDTCVCLFHRGQFYEVVMRFLTVVHQPVTEATYFTFIS